MALLMKSEMESVGSTISWWQAKLRLVLWTAGIIASLWLFGLSDIFLQFGRLGRIMSWLALLAMAVGAFWTVTKSMSQKWTVLGVAATVERAFPQLDNKLINYIQFGAATDGDVFKKAYVRRGIPEWRSIDIAQMKNRKKHLRANLVLCVALALIVTPGIVTGPTWLVSLWRIVNPFSNTPPVSLTNILEISPGDTTLLQGNPVILSCKVKGKKSHRIAVDVKPADNERTTYDLGKILSSDPEEFTYRIPKLSTDVEYRFRAGDAPFPKWHKIVSRPPLAFTKIELMVSPPDYTGLKPRSFDGMGDPVQIFQGSEATLTIICNQPVTNAVIVTKDPLPIQMVKIGDGRSWQAKTAVKDAGGFKFVARNTYNEQIETPVAYEMMPDREAAIEIFSPKGRTVLAEGGVPSVRFTAQDDYGLKEVWIERVAAGSVKGAVGEVLEKWQPGDFNFDKSWTAANLQMKTGEPIVLRVVAVDNYPFGDRKAMSSAIVFDSVNVTNAMQQESMDMAAAAANLNKVITMQKQNVVQTTKLRDAAAIATPEQWNEIAKVQEEIRQITGKILQSKNNPLGGMTTTVRSLHANDMQGVIARLKETALANGDAKAKLAGTSLAMEETILRKLTFADAAAAKSQSSKKMTGLMALLENLIKGQARVLVSTEDFIKKSAVVGKPLVDQQDNLAADVSAFIAACEEEAKTTEGSDKNFAAMIAKTAQDCRDKAIQQDMILAAEKLDSNAARDAVPLEQSALAKLNSLQGAMNQLLVSNAENRLEEVIDVVQETSEKLDKLGKLTGKVVESMLLTEKSKDQNTKEMDMMEEEAKELRENMKEAMLQIPIDLQIFPELSVANDMVDDVITGFEEVEQVAGSEDWGADKVMEIATLKPESLIDMMAKAKDRLDAVDMWLPDQPDTIKSTTESFDREEMPKMALGALPSAVEDLIGDLLEESEELEEAAKDSATNQGMADVPPGWEVAEGNIESFGAQGKAGNQMPDHKEQGGRGNLGRQGMANGEAAASAGQIGEGDPNIEERITPDPLQSGQVQADGEADTKATGGGKMGSGSADGTGMAGNGKDRRMDSTAEGSLEGLKSLMAKTDATYIKCNLLGLRSDSLASAAHHFRQASDAAAEGLPISQIKEYERKAIADLKRAQTELGSGVSAGLGEEGSASALTDVVDGGTDLIPSKYRDLVSEYYKSLGQAL